MTEVFLFDVRVGDQTCKVSVRKSGKVTWKAVGEFQGKPIEAVGGSRQKAVDRWQSKANKSIPWD